MDSSSDSDKPAFSLALAPPLSPSMELKLEPKKPAKPQVQRLSPEALAPGMWIECTIPGRKKQVLCVLKNFSNQGQVWLASMEDPATHISVSHRQLRSSRMVFLGRGTKRWWWGLLPWRRSVMPFDPLPKA